MEGESAFSKLLKYLFGFFYCIYITGALENQPHITGFYSQTPEQQVSQKIGKSTIIKLI
jgi:hypothetical protein